MWNARAGWETASLNIRSGLVVLAMIVVTLCAPSASADPADSQQAKLERLLEQDARLSRLIERDPKLLTVLESDPEMVEKLANWGPLHVRIWRALADPWVIFGFAAQSLFMMRFLIQWIASERKQRSHVPVIFWYFSIGGGLMTLSYAIHRRDPVFMAGQSLGLMIYIRNLVLIYRRKWAYQELLAERAANKGGVAGELATPEPSGVS